MSGYIESNVPKKLADPVTSDYLFSMVNPRCPECYACRANREAAERLLMQELNETHAENAGTHGSD